MTPHDKYVYEHCVKPRLRNISKSLDKFIESQSCRSDIAREGTGEAHLVTGRVDAGVGKGIGDRNAKTERVSVANSQTQNQAPRETRGPTEHDRRSVDTLERQRLPRPVSFPTKLDPHEEQDTLGGLEYAPFDVEIEITVKCAVKDCHEEAETTDKNGYPLCLYHAESIR